MSLAISYAKALYQAAKEVDGSAESMDTLENHMSAFAESLKDPKIHDAILGPVISAKEKTALIEMVAQKVGFSKTFKNFLFLLAHRRRLPVFAKVQAAFSAVRLGYEGGVEGTLVSAEAVSDADVQGLAKAFGSKLGKKVAFRVSTDPTLLAGMKVTVNGVTYDGSLRSQLAQLRERLVAAAPAR
jgi:F-type H+-transporting ATPase subunit delta